jgi:hypothetical protein
MPAYYIGEHKISNVALFDDYLTKVVPMIERFGGRYLTKAGFTPNTGGGLETQSGGDHRISRYYLDQELVRGTGIPATHRFAPKRCDRCDDHARRTVKRDVPSRLVASEIASARGAAGA